LVKFGLVGLCLWGAIAVVSIWFNTIAAGEPVMIEVAQAEPAFDQRTNEPVISIKLTEASGRVIASLTQKYVGKPMAMRVDGREVMKPVIREPILGGALQVSGRFSVDEAKTIAQRLSSGGKLEVEVLD
jgi:preprotein translocase subunit SecD